MKWIIWLGERNEAFLHKDTSKWIRFFSRPWRPSAFQLFKSTYSAPNGQIYPIFVWTLRRFHDLAYSKVSAAGFFSASYKREKFQFSDFLEGKAYIFEPCLYSKLGNANVFVFALINGAPFSWPAVKVFTNVFFRSVELKKSWNFWIFL